MKQVRAAVATNAPSAEWRAEMKSNPVPYENPVHSVLIVIDEVGVKWPKAHRWNPSPSGSPSSASEEPKQVHHTVIQLEQDSATDILVARGVFQMLRLLLAFLPPRNWQA